MQLVEITQNPVFNGTGKTSFLLSIASFGINKLSLHHVNDLIVTISGILGIIYFILKIAGSREDIKFRRLIRLQKKRELDREQKEYDKNIENQSED